MDPFGISALASTATALSQTRLHSEMSVRTLKKAMDVQEQAALSLIEAASTVTYGRSGGPRTPAASGAGLDITA